MIISPYIHDNHTEGQYHGELVEPGRSRIEDKQNPQAWIEAEYEDGWWQRKLMDEDPAVYQNMIHPYEMQCVFCREWWETQVWGYESSFCPRCEQIATMYFPEIIEWLVDEDPVDVLEAIEESREKAAVGDGVEP